MSLLEELAAGASGCKVCLYLRTAAPAVRDEWERALVKPVNEVGNTATAVALARRGVAVTEASVRRHRAKHLAVR